MPVWPRPGQTGPVSPQPPRADADVPGYVAALQLPGLADVHVHFLPERMLEKVWAWFDAHGWGGPGTWPIRYRLPEQERLATVRALGLAAVPALTYAHKPGMAGWLTEWCLDFAARVPDAVRCGTFYPEPEAPGYVTAALERGVRLWKVHLRVGDFHPADPLLDPVWGMVQEAGTPVVLHAGHDPHPGRHTGLAPVEELLRRYPRLVLVIAHMGMPDYTGFTDLAARYPGVHLDTTMVGTDFIEAHSPSPPDLPARLADLEQQVVLGSDFPNIPYSYAHQLEALHRWDLGEAWLRAVLWRNGARLLGLADPTCHTARP